MKTITASNVTAESLSKLDDVAAGLPEGDLREAIAEVTETVREGRDVVVAADAERISPAMAAKFIGVSRTHLYKIMDSGELPWVPVGRDRRILIADVWSYLLAQDEVRKEAAERFAHPSDLRDAALRRYKSKQK